MKALLIAAIVVLFALVSIEARRRPGLIAPPAPNISETFESLLHVEDRRSNATYYGQGEWAQNFGLGESVQQWDIEGPNGNDHFLYLARYDTEKSYTLNELNRTCTVGNLTGTIPANWGWLASATFEGTFNINEHFQVNVWNLLISPNNFTLATPSNNNNIPVFYSHHDLSTNNTLYVEFTAFNPTTPNNNWFNVPSQCN